MSFFAPHLLACGRSSIKLPKCILARSTHNRQILPQTSPTTEVETIVGSRGVQTGMALDNQEPHPAGAATANHTTKNTEPLPSLPLTRLWHDRRENTVPNPSSYVYTQKTRDASELPEAQLSKRCHLTPPSRHTMKLGTTSTHVDCHARNR